MDTYGHLFPKETADAVDKLDSMLTVHAETLAATGTDGPEKRSAGRSTQNAKPCIPNATGCESTTETEETITVPNPLRVADIGDTLLPSASQCDVDAPLAQLAEQLTLNQ